MNPTIEVDERTAQALMFAARMSNTTAGQVVARMVDEASLLPANAHEDTSDGRINIHADYMGFRTEAMYDPATSRVDIVGGPLDGTSRKSPTGAAKAVIAHYNPNVSPHRNGWSFWYLADGRTLETIRYL